MGREGDHHEEKMDRFSAHLDRGWDLVQHGDSHGAELSARRALELNKQAPEAYNLLGYAAALRGDFEAAIRHYNHALSLDEAYFEALLNAAEVFIHPGFEFRVISGLLTNFHLPKSSLLMLVSAFAGRERVLEAYREAIARRYRFYSYGDAMLIV